MSKSGRFGLCDGCNERMMLYPENDYQCASCTDSNSLGGVLDHADWFDSPRPVFVAGRQATGRTNAALGAGEETSARGWSVASNVPSCQEATHVGAASELREWAARAPGEKLFIFDEAEAVLPMGTNAQMRLLVKDLADLGVTPVFVVLDVPEFAKEVGGVSIRMQDPKTARVGPEDNWVEVDDVPMTSWTYDTCDMATWSWD